MSGRMLCMSDCRPMTDEDFDSYQEETPSVGRLELEAAEENDFWICPECCREYDTATSGFIAVVNGHVGCSVDECPVHWERQGLEWPG